MLRNLRNLLLVVGAFKVGTHTANAGYQIYAHTLREPMDLKERYGKDTYALVTGPTSGFGKEYAREFARRGFNVVLVGRNPEKLENVKQEIEKEFGVKVRSVKYDFINSTKYNELLDIEKQLRDIDISVLVNNVGVCAVTDFGNFDPDELNNHMVVNMFPMTFLTYAFVKRFRNRQKKSAIINIGSEAGEVPFPYMQIYAGTKAFINHLSLSVNEEVKDKIDMVAVTPNLSQTNILSSAQANAEKTKGKVMLKILEWTGGNSANASATSVINALGYETYTAGTLKHYLILEVFKATTPLSIYFRALGGRSLAESFEHKSSRDLT